MAVSDEIMLSPEKLRVHNIVKYKVQPSWRQVYKTMVKAGLENNMTMFELAYGLAPKTLTKFKNGVSLPPRYWHIFYGYDDLGDRTKEKYINQVVEKRKVPSVDLTIINKVNGFKQHL